MPLIDGVTSGSMGQQQTETRRRVVGWLASAAMLAALDARAQQSSVPVIGYLSDRSAASDAHLIDALRQGLGEAGFAEGRNLSITYRFAEGKSDTLEALATDLVERRVALIFAAGGISAVTAKTKTSGLPVVFVSTSDPLANHLVASLSRPGANVTGISLTAVALAPKRARCSAAKQEAGAARQSYDRNDHSLGAEGSAACRRS
jgi:putative ABC transport system substrate-binding protein